MAISTFESEARFDKAWQWARWLLAEGFNAEQVATWDEDQWGAVHMLADHLKLPSEKTQGVIVGFLVGSERKR